jgi:site-specific recombinase XerC
VIKRRSGGHFPALTRPENPLSDLQVAQLLEKEYDLRNRVILELFILSGLQLMEVATLEIARIDWVGKELTVSGRGYHGRPHLRTRPAPAPLLDRLQAYLGRRVKGYVFPGRDGPHITDRAIQDVVRAAGARIGVHLSPRMLRATCVRRLLDAGLTHADLIEIFGYENIVHAVGRLPRRSYKEVKEKVLTCV